VILKGFFFVYFLNIKYPYLLITLIDMSLFIDKHTALALKYSGVCEIDANALITSLAAIPGALDKIAQYATAGIHFSELYCIYQACVPFGNILYEKIDSHIWSKILDDTWNPEKYAPGESIRVHGKYICRFRSGRYTIEVKMNCLKTTYKSKWQHDLAGGRFKIKITDIYGLRIPINDKTHQIVIELDTEKRFIRFALHPRVPSGL
jgi:hypothetical protein